jgi:hypothetical protein
MLALVRLQHDAQGWFFDDPTWFLDNEPKRRVVRTRLTVFRSHGFETRKPRQGDEIVCDGAIWRVGFDGAEFAELGSEVILVDVPKPRFHKGRVEWRDGSWWHETPKGWRRVLP